MTIELTLEVGGSPTGDISAGKKHTNRREGSLEEGRRKTGMQGSLKDIGTMNGTMGGQQTESLARERLCRRWTTE